MPATGAVIGALVVACIAEHGDAREVGQFPSIYCGTTELYRPIPGRGTALEHRNAIKAFKTAPRVLSRLILCS